MRKKLLFFLTAAVIVAALVATAYWPQQILITPMVGQSTKGLYVVLLRKSEWERFAVEANGRVTIGLGAWSFGKRCPMMVAVGDQQRLFWEGEVAPRLFERIRIQISSGRPLSANEASHFKELDGKAEVAP